MLLQFSEFPGDQGKQGFLLCKWRKPVNKAAILRAMVGISYMDSPFFNQNTIFLFPIRLTQ